MAFIKAVGCKICQSRLRGEIDELFAKGKTQSFVIKWAKKKKLLLNKYNASNHYRKHRDSSLMVKAKKKVGINEKENKKKTKAAMATAGIVLQQIVNDVAEALAIGTIKPTLAEGLKAIELLNKAGEGNEIEKKLMSFIQGITIGN